ncbi:MAG TPA: mycothiol synthase [Dermatophilaceae bacterium]
MPRQVDVVGRLTGQQLSGVLGLVRTAGQLDEVAPLSEQVLLSVRDSLTADPADASAVSTTAPHFLVYDGSHLAGYAHRDAGVAGDGSTAELVVEPSVRRQGTGTALIHALEAATLRDAGLDDAVARDAVARDAVARDAVARDAAVKDPASGRTPAPPVRTLRVWAHGDLPAGRAFALRFGYSTVRELWQMSRSLGPDGALLPAASLPGGFRSRHFVVGQDEEAWLRVNARAFVDHPEQGRVSRHDLDQRIAEPWFDAGGFILVEDTRGPVPVLAASHWTKVVPAEGPDPDRTTRPALPPAGEVYVVGVDPAYQGLGVGRAVTVLGLAHLRERGLAEAMLYVDADNRAAVATYARLDFTRRAVDIMYARTVHPPV